MELEQLVNYTKKNVTSVVGIASFVVAIVGGTIVFEDRYAKAADLIEVRVEISQAVDQNYKRQLEDKLFELRLKPNPTATDRALIQRYEQQLQEVIQRLNRR